MAGLPAVVLACPIPVFCISIFCNGREPCHDIGIRKIESGSDKRVQQIRFFVSELLDPFPASVHRKALRDAPLSWGVEAAAETMGNHKDAERVITEIPSAILSGDILELPEPKRGK